MSVPAAFVGVVLIWSTTPLAIQWSGDGVGFLFGVAARMLIALLLCSLLVALMSRRMRWRGPALKTYLVAGVGLWAAMTSVYWGAQRIPSGLVSVVFGLTPLVTGLMAALWLRERAFGWSRLLGMLFAMAGLVVLFGHGIKLGEQAHWGIGAILLAVLFHSASAVGVKRIDAHLHPLETTTGTLMVAVPLFMLSWIWGDGQWPTQISQRTLSAILYLAVFGSVLGFIFYFYVLKRVQASQVAMTTLITPMIALWLGQWLNAEQIDWLEWLGSGLILLGLALYQWGHRWIRAGIPLLSGSDRRQDA